MEQGVSSNHVGFRDAGNFSAQQAILPSPPKLAWAWPWPHPLSGGTTAPRSRTCTATSSACTPPDSRSSTSRGAMGMGTALARDAWTRVAARLVGHIDSGRAEDSAALEQPHPRMSSEFRNSRKAGVFFGICCLVRLSASARNSWVCESLRL